MSGYPAALDLPGSNAQTHNAFPCFPWYRFLKSVPVSPVLSVCLLVPWFLPSEARKAALRSDTHLCKHQVPYRLTAPAPHTQVFRNAPVPGWLHPGNPHGQNPVVLPAHGKPTDSSAADLNIKWGFVLLNADIGPGHRSEFHNGSLCPDSDDLFLVSGHRKNLLPEILQSDNFEMLLPLNHIQWEYPDASAALKSAPLS